MQTVNINQQAFRAELKKQIMDRKVRCAGHAMELAREQYPSMLEKATIMFIETANECVREITARVAVKLEAMRK